MRIVRKYYTVTGSHIETFYDVEVNEVLFRNVSELELFDLCKGYEVSV